MRNTVIFNYSKRFKEIWFFIRFLTFKKSINYIIAFLSYWIASAFKIPLIWGNPVSLSIETSMMCNLHCPQCPAGTNELNRAKGLMNKAVFQKIIDETGKYLISLTLHFQGEPFCNPDILKMIAYAREKRIYTVLSTNGHFLNDTLFAEQLIDAGLNRIIISLDGATQDSYALYRVGGQLIKVEQGIKKLMAVRYRKGSAFPFVVIQTLVFEHNENEIKTIRSNAKSWQTDMHQIKTAQFYHFKVDNTVKIPVKSSFSRYKKDERFGWQLKRKITNRCLRLWLACVVTWDGDVLPCCYDKDAEHKLGNIYELPLGKIWKSSASRRFRKKVLKNIRQIGICNNCNK